MQVKKQRDSNRSTGNMLEGAAGPRKNSSCFSNIKIFLISECALMLAQGTVGAYLVSCTLGLPGSEVEVRVRCVTPVLALHAGLPAASPLRRETQFAAETLHLP